MFHHVEKAAGQFMDPGRIPGADSFRREQVLADPQRSGTGADVISGRLLSHATGSDESGVGKGVAQRPYIGRPANGRAWENFDERSSGFPGHHDFGRSKDPGNDPGMVLVGKLDKLNV